MDEEGQWKRDILAEALPRQQVCQRVEKLRYCATCARNRGCESACRSVKSNNKYLLRNKPFDEKNSYFTLLQGRWKTSSTHHHPVCKVSEDVFNYDVSLLNEAFHNRRELSAYLKGRDSIGAITS